MSIIILVALTGTTLATMPIRFCADFFCFKGTPGMKIYDVKYHIKGHKHHGPFHQGGKTRSLLFH
jgi:hypothetical protein